MTEDSALTVARKQLDWYRTHKTRARISHYALELVALALSVVVTIAGILGSDPAVPAIAGAALVVLATLRGLFESRQSWIAWAGAEAELEKAIDYYASENEPYDGPDRDKQLVRRVWEVRTSETEAWQARKSSPPPPPAEELGASPAGEIAGGNPPGNLRR